jgi:hypothetical protein
MAASGVRSGAGKQHRSSGWLASVLAGAAAFLAPAGAQAQNLTYNEVKFGVLAHDVHFLGGKEGGVDLNP